MTEYVCDRCLYGTTRKTNIISHLNKNVVCEAKNNISIEDVREKYGLPRNKVIYTCPNCPKTFGHKPNLTSHLKSCNKKRVPLLPTVQSSENVSSTMEELLTVIREMKKEMKTELQQIKNTIGTTNITYNNTQHIHNEINITINDFGQENKDYITPEFAMKCFEKGGYGIISMINEIYFNDNHTENNNVRIQSIRSMMGEIFQNKIWIRKHLDEIITQMMTSSYKKILQDVPEENKEDDKNVYIMNELLNPDPKMSKHIFKKTTAKLLDRRAKQNILQSENHSTVSSHDTEHVVLDGVDYHHVE